LNFEVNRLDARDYELYFVLFKQKLYSCTLCLKKRPTFELL